MQNAWCNRRACSWQFEEDTARGLLVLILEWHVHCFLRPASELRAGESHAATSKTRNAWNQSSPTALISSKERELCFQTVTQKRKRNHPKTRGQIGQEEVQCLFWVKAKGYDRAGEKETIREETLPPQTLSTCSSSASTESSVQVVPCPVS